MTAREAARRYSATDERAAAGFATILLHHWLGHDRIAAVPPANFTFGHGLKGSTSAPSRAAT